jgi:hypothetical protein
MRLYRPALAVAVIASAFAFVMPSDAAPVYQGKSFHLADAKGDGNGINDQGEGLSAASAPVGGYDGYDILGVDYKGMGTMVKKGRIYFPQCTGFTVTMTFGAALGPSAIIRTTGVGVVNDALWWLQYDGKATTLRYGHKSADVTGSTDDTIALKTPAKVSGATVTWTVLESDLKATGEKLSKFSVSGMGATVRTNTGVVTAPQWDEIPNGDAFFKAC